MVMNIADALAAYKQGGGLMGQNASVGGASDGGNFSDVLKGFAGDAMKSLESGEKAATSAASGKGNIANVVTAISDAELMLQTVVTIRDKVIQAYQTITQMPV